MMSFRISTHLVGAILLCATLAACDGKGDEQAAGGMPGMGAGMPAPKVTAAKPVVKPIREWDEFSGRFEATDTVEVRARVSGYVQSIDFQDGALVKKGDPLFHIDPAPFEAIVAQRNADVKAAQSRIELAKNTYDRAQSLFNSGDISAQILDQRKSEYVTAVASVDQAKAALSAARLDLSYAVIKAPIDGRISNELVSVGNLVGVGEPVLTTIVSVDPIHFYFDVNEQTYLKYARVGEGADPKAHAAYVGLVDEEGFPHEGRLDFIDNAISEGTGTMRGRAVLANPDGLITPGMFGRVRLVGSKEYNAVQIPDEAIGIDQSRKFVMTVGQDGTVTSKAVVTGPVIDGLRVIRSGLDGSETIIINGLQRAQEGAKVQAEIVDLTKPQQAPQAAAPAAGAPASTTEETPAAE